MQNYTMGKYSSVLERESRKIRGWWIDISPQRGGDTTVRLLVMLLHTDKAPMLQVIQVNPAKSQEALLGKRRAESSHRAADIVDGTTKDVILSDPSK